MKLTPVMRLAEHLTAFRAWCQRMSAGRRKPDVLRPGIERIRGATRRVPATSNTRQVLVVGLGLATG